MTGNVDPNCLSAQQRTANTDFSDFADSTERAAVLLLKPVKSAKSVFAVAGGMLVIDTPDVTGTCDSSREPHLRTPMTRLILTLVPK